MYMKCDMNIMTKTNFRTRIQKTYTKKDLEKALGLKNKGQLPKELINKVS